MSRKHKLWLSGAVGLALLIIIGLFFQKPRIEPADPAQPPAMQVPAPAPFAAWPWPDARKEALRRGVTHWFARQPDGTTVDLLHFDFGANPGLRLELFDQDEDDEQPLDNVVDYEKRGVAQVTRQLNARLKANRSGHVVAAWNGLFFGYYHKEKAGLGFHVAPVVLRGKVLYNRINRRWTFGVHYRNGKPVFRVLHLPNRARLAEFDFAAASAQCLIQDGKPLKVQPYPPTASKRLKAPVPSLPHEAGHVPTFDHMLSSRVSWGWSHNHRHLYLLVVMDVDGEMASMLAFRHNQVGRGGWSVLDVQRFWRAMVRQNKVWNAVNSDAGGVAQLAYRLPDGKYMLLPSNSQNRLVVAPDFKNAPRGGGIMFFYVRDIKD